METYNTRACPACKTPDSFVITKSWGSKLQPEFAHFRWECQNAKCHLREFEKLPLAASTAPQTGDPSLADGWLATQGVVTGKCPRCWNERQPLQKAYGQWVCAPCSLQMKETLKNVSPLVEGPQPKNPSDPEKAPSNTHKLSCELCSEETTKLSVAGDLLICDACKAFCDPGTANF